MTWPEFFNGAILAFSGIGFGAILSNAWRQYRAKPLCRHKHLDFHLALSQKHAEVIVSVGTVIEHELWTDMWAQCRTCGHAWSCPRGTVSVMTMVTPVTEGK